MSIDLFGCWRPANNRFDNLRSAGKSSNAANQRIRKTNSSGWKGVSRFEQKFKAQICVQHQRLYLGLFDCPAAAHFAYVIAADQHFGAFARFN